MSDFKAMEILQFCINYWLTRATAHATCTAQPQLFMIYLHELMPEEEGSSLGQGSSSAVNCIQVGVAQIQLAANQNDGCPGTKVLDLRKPHGAYMAQGIGISQREAEHHHIRPARGINERDGMFVCCCQDQEVSNERRAAFDGGKGAEKPGKWRSVLSHWASCQLMLNMCDMHEEGACPTAARPRRSMDVAIDKAGVTRHVCVAMSVSMSLDL